MEKKEEKKGGCFCKQEENQFYWSDKLTCDQRKKVLEVCQELWGEKNKKEKASQLMSIMYIETNKTFSSSADNGIGFSGLIQFNDAAAKGVGTTRAELKKMTFIKQMDYVKAYFMKRKDELNTMTDMYLLVMKPSAVGKGNDPNYAVFDESISVPDGDGSKTNAAQRQININREPWVTKYGYSSNPKFLTEKGEKEKRKKWVYTRQKYESRPGFIGGKTTIKEIEQVLKDEGFYLGKNHIFKGKCINEKETNNYNKNRAPWMKIALDKAKEMKGCKEGTEPMYSNAKKFLQYCNNSAEPTDSDNGPWCAAFMNWCISQTINSKTNKPYSHAKSAASLAPLDSTAGKKYKEIDEPIYGCIVVYKHKNKWKGHTGFLYGKTSNGDYILIGGNQEDTIRFDSYGEYTSKSKTKKLYGFYIPEDYEYDEDDKLKSSNTYNSVDTINSEYGITASKGGGKTV
ncbi:TIGR02594 family protein [Flavobacterium columnare]|uniref:TIGR02594 family protein n=1 Tax=Flavobacterium columnare TaxID=996 RepID=UPI0013D3DF59|nr:TIGR02594 family protein [Flavobacterium columnare]